MSSTSPSVYLSFSQLNFQDSCGLSTLGSTILSFLPSDLSTLRGQIGGPDALWATPQSFNYDDLPCSPKTVASANWWKAAPGEPYRPLIALPQNIEQRYTEFSTCFNGFLTLLDPPKALTPEAAMVSRTPFPTSSQILHTLEPNMPDRPGSSTSRASPVAFPVADLPRETSLTPIPNPKDHDGGRSLHPIPHAPAAGPPQGFPHNDDASLYLSSSVSIDNNAPSWTSLHITEGNHNPHDSGGASQEVPKADDDRDHSQGLDSQQNPDLRFKSIDMYTYAGLSHDSGATRTQDGVPGKSMSVPGESTSQISLGKGDLGNAIISGIRAAIEPTEGRPRHFKLPQSPSGVDGQITKSGAPMPTNQEDFNAGLTDGGKREGSYRNDDPTTSNCEAIPELRTPDPVSPPGLDIQPVSNGVRIAGVVLTPGAGAITISSTRVSLGSSAFVYGTRTIPYNPTITPIATAADPPMTSIAGQLIAPIPNGHGISVAGTTLIPGAPGITVSGSPISLGSSAFVIGTDTINKLLPSGGASATAVVTIAGQVVTPLPDGKGVFLPGETFTPGENVVISGTPVSLASDVVVLDGSTFTLRSPTETRRDDAEEPLVTTLGSQVLTADASAIAFNGTTISAGANAVSINGQVISLGTRSRLIIGSSTLKLGAQDLDLDGLSPGSSTDISDHDGPPSLTPQLPSPASTSLAGETSSHGEETGKETHKSDAARGAGLYRLMTMILMKFVMMLVVG